MNQKLAELSIAELRFSVHRARRLFCWAALFLLLVCLLFVSVANAQTNGQAFPADKGPYQSGQVYVLPQSAVPMVPQASVFPTAGTGTTVYFYWIVTHDITNSRFSIPAGPFFTSIGPATLSATQSITIRWPVFSLPLTYGQTSSNATPFTTSSVTYDVLRTATGTPPSGACACAVATGLTVATIADTGTLGAYTVNVPLSPGNFPTSGNVAGFGPKGILIDGGVVIPGASIAGIFTVATLPVAPATNTLAIVTDGIGGIGAGGSSTDCTVGGGTTGALCRWTGSVWAMVGELVPRGPNNAIQFNASGKQNGSANFLWSDATSVLQIGLFGPEILFQCTNVGGCVGIGDLISEIASNSLDSTSTAVQLSNIQTLYNSTTHNAVLSEMDLGVTNGVPLNTIILKADAALGGTDLILPGATSGFAPIRVAAVAGTPNALQLPTATGAAGAVLTTDGNNPQQLSWSLVPSHPIQAYSVTTESVDTALTGSVAATVITHAVTMPSAGCPCRVAANWAQYMVTTGSAIVAEAWVSDGTVNFAEAEWPIDVNNGPSGTGAGFSSATYANNAVITFTLKIEVDGSSSTAKAAPFHAFGLRNSRLELTVIPSN